MPLEDGQAWGIDHLSWKPVPGFDHPLCKEMSPDAFPKVFLISSMTGNKTFPAVQAVCSSDLQSTNNVGRKTHLHVCLISKHNKIVS